MIQRIAWIVILPVVIPLAVLWFCLWLFLTPVMIPLWFLIVALEGDLDKSVGWADPFRIFVFVAMPWMTKFQKVDRWVSRVEE